MHVTLSNQFEQLVRKLIETGRYDSEQEVVEAGVARLILDGVDSGVEEIDDDTAATISRSEEQIRAGRVRTLDDAVAELRAKHFGQ